MSGAGPEKPGETEVPAGPDPLLRFRAEMPIVGRYLYLNHAAIGPLPRRSAERMAALARVVSETGDRRWPERNAEVERVRALAARLIGATDPHEVAFVENTSVGLSAVAEGIDWRPGDNMVGAEGEFPSNAYPWMNVAARAGNEVEYRLAPERDGRIEPEDLLARIDGRTRLLALSWVQYATGFRSDLARLGAACRERGALFVVDAIQGLGALAVDVEALGIDVLAAATHKWLLGPEGIGLLYVSDRVIDRLRPTRAGWRSTRTPYDWSRLDLTFAEGAKRFECGTLNVYGLAGLGGSLEILLEAGPEAIERRVLALAERTAAGFEAAGLTLAAPRDGAFRGETSGIVAGAHPTRTPEELAEALAGRGVVVSARAGRLRAAPHFYNSEAEIDRFVAILAELAGS
ncbi:MAG TPA: aminotransferase class V-fold PLP-dependent enzyme [Thermoanaerobaculia bacterium]|nr:aminotransferase class V-fold PLP-dependent enzyme [Thermoanaerobaculia bacterium]